MNEQERTFRSSQSLRLELAEILKQPTLQRALDALRSSPDEFPAPIHGVHYDLVLGREHAKTIGANSTIKRLYALTKEPAKESEFQKEATREEWGDYLPAELAKALEQQNQPKQS